MSSCPAGQAVVLRALGPKTVFLVGPMRLHAGVTLVIEADVALWGSRDPRVYDVQLVPPEDKTFYVAADGTGDFNSVLSAVNRVPATGGWCWSRRGPTARCSWSSSRT